MAYRGNRNRTKDSKMRKIKGPRDNGEKIESCLYHVSLTDTAKCLLYFFFPFFILFDAGTFVILFHIF